MLTWEDPFFFADLVLVALILILVIRYESALRDMELRLQDSIRKARIDSTERSASVLVGKLSEEFAPVYLSSKLHVDPRDFRHLGSPVDFVAFRGLSDEGREPVDIVFIEIKAGKPSLSQRERRVKDAVESKRVSYFEFDIGSLARARTKA
ncbi:MAG: Holliday junction resolvase-like protein [Thermoprotei archaeon]|nr:Holliday junction resolvase-like protein [TACK group archaeon]